MGTKHRALPGECGLPTTSPLLPRPHFPMLVPSLPTHHDPPFDAFHKHSPVSFAFPQSPSVSHNQFSLSYETFSEQPRTQNKPVFFLPVKKFLSEPFQGHT